MRVAHHYLSSTSASRARRTYTKDLHYLAKYFGGPKIQSINIVPLLGQDTSCESIDQRISGAAPGTGARNHLETSVLSCIGTYNRGLHFASVRTNRYRPR